MGAKLLAMNALETLKERLAEINDLQNAAALLHWDQATYMPAGGAEARGRQLATLSRLAHEKFVAPEIGELLQNAQPEDEDEKALIAQTQREWERAAKIPVEFEARLATHTASTYEAWTRARPADDFASVRPLLEKTLDLSCELAGFFKYQHPLDPLIDFSDPGSTVAQIRPLFAELRKNLVPLVEEVTEFQETDVNVLRGHFPEAKQAKFSRRVLTAVGYDWNRGRLDKTHHPFMTKFSLGDVRITNRCSENDFQDYFFGALHETGHALYEQGIDAKYEGTLLANGASSGIHESQSRLWENMVGRSRTFWSFWYPQLVELFPNFTHVPLDTFLGAINHVEKSLIRTDADELTYNLHVLIRFELEAQMLEGKLAVQDLPEAWREAYRENLGVFSETDANGCLQDVHWFGGTIGGAFQGYTLGNILSAQFFAQAREEKPEIDYEMAVGEFDTLRGWLTEKIYQHGAKWLPNELVEHATGRALELEPYLRYLREKYTT